MSLETSIEQVIESLDVVITNKTELVLEKRKEAQRLKDKPARTDEEDVDYMIARSCAEFVALNVQDLINIRQQLVLAVITARG